MFEPIVILEKRSAIENAEMVLRSSLNVRRAGRYRSDLRGQIIRC